MRERIEKLLHEDKELNLPLSFSEKPFMSTFHSLGVHILKENSSLLGYPRHFGIFDKSDSKKAIKEAMENLMIDITNELAGCSDKFNRNDFLRRCGHPQYQPQVARRGL